jgi:hypothetical protein
MGAVLVVSHECNGCTGSTCFQGEESPRACENRAPLGADAPIEGDVLPLLHHGKWEGVTGVQCPKALA